MTVNGSEPSSTGNGNALRNLNWPTVALIALTGGGNLLATNQNSQQRQYDYQRASSQINDLHNALDDFEKRQKQQLADLENILQNETKMLQNQSDVISELRKK
jgi:hypothetical protein